MQTAITLLNSKPRWLVLTGAGVSAESGVPTYRNRRGEWQRKPPVTHQEFVGNHQARQRFWARNLVGWRFMSDAQPNAAHNSRAPVPVWQSAGLSSASDTRIRRHTRNCPTSSGCA